MVSGVLNSTKTEPLKSLDTTWRRKRTPLVGPTEDQNVVSCSSEASKGKGVAYYYLRLVNLMMNFFSFFTANSAHNTFAAS